LRTDALWDAARRPSDIVDCTVGCMVRAARMGNWTLCSLGHAVKRRDRRDADKGKFFSCGEERYEQQHSENRGLNHERKSQSLGAGTPGAPKLFRVTIHQASPERAFRYWTNFRGLRGHHTPPLRFRCGRAALWELRVPFGSAGSALRQEAKPAPLSQGCEVRASSVWLDTGKIAKFPEARSQTMAG
jgi:hypothetical protein